MAENKNMKVDDEIMIQSLNKCITREVLVRMHGSI